MCHWQWMVGLVLSGFGCVAAAVTLPADGSLRTLPGVTVAEQPLLAGKVVEDVTTRFSYDIDANDSGASFLTYTLAGSVRSRVLLGVDGSYDFDWRVTPDPKVPVRGTDVEGNPIQGIDEPPYQVEIAVSSFTLAAFAAPIYRADWRADSVGQVAPAVAAGGGGKVVFAFGDDFVNPVTGAIESLPVFGMFPNEDSMTFFVDTDAHGYAKTASFALHSAVAGLFAGDSADYATFAPTAVTPVPEPATWALMLGGFGALLMVTRRRRGCSVLPSGPIGTGSRAWEAAP